MRFHSEAGVICQQVGGTTGVVRTGGRGEGKRQCAAATQRVMFPLPIHLQSGCSLGSCFLARCKSAVTCSSSRISRHEPPSYSHIQPSYGSIRKHEPSSYSHTQPSYGNLMSATDRPNRARGLVRGNHVCCVCGTLWSDLIPPARPFPPPRVRPVVPDGSAQQQYTAPAWGGGGGDMQTAACLR